MVSWASDGLLSGYDPVQHKLNAGLYHLASGGTVDLNGVTRLGAAMGAGLNANAYPNRLGGSVSYTFTSSDFTNNPGKLGFAAALVVVNATEFPDGYIPKPSEILAVDASRQAFTISTQYATSAGTIALTLPGFGPPFSPDKLWVLMVPVAVIQQGAPSDLAHWPVMNGINVDTFGRAVSLWLNRSPEKPVITSPAQGTIVSPGNSFTLSFNSGDPDATTPLDAKKYNADVVGVEVQYAPAPTADNPNPTWKDLRVALTTTPWMEECWIIKGARGTETERLNALTPIVDNLGMTVRCGATSGPYVAGRGELPSGDWVLRVRTFEYGHPYPNEGTDWSMPGPGGLNQNTTVWKYPARDNYPPGFISPWSDPVKVSVPSQVPPPLLTHPIDHEAVPESTTVRLDWKYRNTHIPAYNQYYRTVQIRKVGDPDWATVFNGVSGNAYVDLPPSLTQSSLPAVSLLADANFEGGTKDGWDKPVGTRYSGQVVSNVLDASKAHSGSRSLIGTNDGTGTDKYVSFTKTVPASALPAADYLTLEFDGWVYIPDPSLRPTILIQGVWYDADNGTGNAITDSPTGSIYDSPFVLYTITGEFASAPGWYRFSDIPAYTGDPKYKDTKVMRPSNGVSLVMLIQVAGNLGALIPEARIDDMTMSFDAVQRDSFSMGATTEYEWRVQTTDSQVVQSDYSEVERFWVVPGPDTGSTRAVPSETIEGATLGCGTHRVQVFRRGGKKFVGEIKNISHLDYSRVRDDISTAQVVISGWDTDCGNLLSKLQCWAYEIVIWRDNGYSTDRVWEGPITLLTYETDKVTIDAKDVMAYAYRRIIKQKMSDAGSGNGTTVVDRARRVLQNAFAPDDPNVLAYLRVLARSDDAMQYRSTPAYSRTAFEEVDDMAANAGLDYTTVGRSIMLWGTKHRIGTLPEFTDEDLGNSPIVSEYGMSMANRYAVSDGNGVWGEATKGLDVSGNDETYGLVEMLSSTWAQDSENESGTYTQAGLATIIESFTHFAERSIADRYPPPVVVRIPDNTSLNPGAAISIQHLVPGVVVPLRSTKTLRTVVASQKLDSVKVVEEGGKETVSITVSPFSRDDAQAVEGA